MKDRSPGGGGASKKLFIDNFIQVRFDGLVLCGLAMSDFPFVYHCTVLIIVLTPLLSADSARFKSQLAKRWYMKKLEDGRLKSDKDASELQHSSQIFCLNNIDETDPDAKPC